MPTVRWLVVLCAVCGCDSVVDQTYRGVPLATLRAVVANETGDVPVRPRAALFWTDSLTRSAPEELVEQVSTSQPVRDGAVYTLNLFEPPERLLPWDEGDLDGPRFGLGRLLVYEDQNDNARHDGDEPFVGGLLPYAVVYAPEELPARQGPSRLSVSRGLHFTWLPLPCSADPVPTDATCGAPLGEACSVGKACGSAGVCVDRFVFPWPMGGCLLPRAECVPADGALLAGDNMTAYYTLACETDEDCERASPYRCDPLQGACVPYNLPRVAVGPVPQAQPFCGGPPGRP